MSTIDVFDMGQQARERFGIGFATFPVENGQHVTGL
jgi:hypothetical protein